MPVVAVIGPDGSGKSSLSSAMAHAQRAVDATSVTPARTVTIGRHSASVFERRSPRGWLQHVDFANAEAERSLLAASPLDGVILVVDATQGLVAATREHLMRARGAGVRRVVTVLAKVDLVEDAELLDLVETELQVTLSTAEMTGSNAPIARVSAKRALEGDRRAAAAFEGLFRTLDAVFAR